MTMKAIREVKTISARLGPRREHAHEEHSVAFVWRGAARAGIEGAPMLVRAGQAILIAAGAPHECAPLAPEDWGYTLLLVREGALGPLDLALAAADRGCLVLDTPAEEGRSIAAAAAEDSEAEALARLADLLDRLGASPRGPAPDSRSRAAPGSVSAAEAFLRASLEGGASLDELAALAGMGKYRLVREFKAAYGLSPHAYLLNLRVNEAKAMLRSGASPVETALACGFCDQSHFGRVFERTVGLPPAAFLRSTLG
jgi:AraC-like DNA-binding protein